MTYEPLHHKYRPQTFADLVGQEAIATTLTNAIRTERIAPAYLFTGSRGTGKTSSARILAKSLNCLASNKPTEQPCGVCDVCKGIAKGSTMDTIEIDAASNTGVDNIREIIEKAQFAPVQCRYKVYVIDEVHSLSTQAFNALLKTLEEPPNRVVFVLATTDPQRVLPTIISRCQRFDFRRIPLEAMVKHLRKIAGIENINITDEAITLVAQVAQGGLRDAESLLDQLSLLAGEVTVERVWDLVGAVPERDLMDLVKAIASYKPEAVIEKARNLMDRGREPLIVLQNLAGFYRDLLIAKTAPNRNDLVAVTAPTWKALCEFARDWDAAAILAGQKHLKDSEAQVKNTTQPRLWLEATLLGLLSSQSSSVVSNGSSVNSNRQTSNGKGHAIEQQQTHPPVAPPIATNSTSAAPTQQKTPQDETPKASPPPVPPVSQPVADVDTGESDFDRIWQQVLTHIQPLSIQSLLRQMCRLIDFDGKEARIIISSQPWFVKAQENKPKIAAAFQKVFQQEVMVRLETVTSNIANTLPERDRRKDKNPAPTPEATKPTTAPSDRSPTPQQPKTVREDEGAATVFTESEELPRHDSEVDEVTIAAQSFAEFFKAEIINLSNDLDAEQSPVIPKPAATHHQQQDLAIAPTPEPEPDDDDDEPF